MNICFVTTGTFRKNAVMKRALRMAPHLRERGVATRLIAVDTEENRELVEASDVDRADFVDGGGPWVERRRKQAIIRAQQPDVVYVCGLGVRNFVTGGQIDLVEHCEILSRLEGMQPADRTKYGLLEWASVFAYDGLILASEYIEDLYRARLRRLPVRRPLLRLPYGSDPASVGAESFQRARNERFRVTYMGYIHENYGVYDILASAKRVLDARDDVMFSIVGDGPDRSNAETCVSELGLQDRIEFHGFLPEEQIDGVLRDADVLLAPMRDTVQDWARCPSKIPMYMAYGKPIVSCRIGEVRNYLGEHGFYYEPEEPDSMAEATLAALAADGSVPYDLDSISWAHLTDRFLHWVQRSFPQDLR